ncbi:hypothetical protein [Fructilactobacillus frigidiflavus]
MNKIMKWVLITGIIMLVIGIIMGGLGYYQGGEMKGLKKAFPNNRIEFNF